MPYRSKEHKAAQMRDYRQFKSHDAKAQRLEETLAEGVTITKNLNLQKAVDGFKRYHPVVKVLREQRFSKLTQALIFSALWKVKQQELSEKNQQLLELLNRYKVIRDVDRPKVEHEIAVLRRDPAHSLPKNLVETRYLLEDEMGQLKESVLAVDTRRNDLLTEIKELEHFVVWLEPSAVRHFGLQPPKAEWIEEGKLRITGMPKGGKLKVKI